MIELRDANPQDLETLHRLNEDAVPHVNSVTFDRMRWFMEVASYFRVANVDEAIAGFLIGLEPGLPYDSLNYRWFVRRYRKFVYVDRVVIAESARRRGAGRALYEDFAAFGQSRAPVMTCEVNVRPPNPGSLDFHRAMGFEEAGRQDTEGGAKTVALLVKRF